MKMPTALRLWWFYHKRSYGHEVELVTRNMVNNVFEDWYRVAKPLFVLVAKYRRKEKYATVNVSNMEGFELKPEVMQWLKERSVDWKMIMRLAPTLPEGEDESKRKTDMVSLFFLDETQAVEFKLTFL